MNDNNTKAIAIGLLLIFFWLRIKKGVGTTLFGIGTKIDLSKPVENLDQFIEAAQQMQAAGAVGTYKIKGLYYQVDAGTTAAFTEVWIGDQGGRKEDQGVMTLQTQKIQPFDLVYKGDGTPPDLLVTNTYMEAFVYPDGGENGITTRTITIAFVNWAKFKKQ